jgi:hypothetical protein
VTVADDVKTGVPVQAELFGPKRSNVKVPVPSSVPDRVAVSVIAPPSVTGEDADEVIDGVACVIVGFCDVADAGGTARINAARTEAVTSGVRMVPPWFLGAFGPYEHHVPLVDSSAPDSPEYRWFRLHRDGVRRTA